LDLTDYPLIRLIRVIRLIPVQTSLRIAVKYDPLLIGEIKGVQLVDINELGLMVVEEGLNRD